MKMLLLIVCFILFLPQNTFSQTDLESPYSYNMGGCGFIGDSPTPQKGREMLQLVINRDYAALKEWLHSPYPEIQAFGVKGMHFLCQMGIAIEEEEIEIIECLQESSVLVNTCSGCLIYYTEPMKNLLGYDDLADAYWYHKGQGDFDKTRQNDSPFSYPSPF